MNFVKTPFFYDLNQMKTKMFIFAIEVRLFIDQTIVAFLESIEGIYFYPQEIEK